MRGSSMSAIFLSKRRRGHFLVPFRALFRCHFGCISEALESALGPWGPVGEVLGVSETGLGIDGFSLIIQSGSRIRSSLKVGGDRWVWGA